MTKTTVTAMDCWTSATSFLGYTAIVIPIRFLTFVRSRLELQKTVTITITRTSVTSLTAFPQTVMATSCLMSVNLSVVLSLTVTGMPSLTLAISLLESV